MAENNEIHKHEHSVGYGYYVLIWLTLISLTCVTVAVAGLNFGSYILLIAMIVAGIKSMLVINVFMHIKFEDPVFKIFFALIIATLIVLFVLTSFDVLFR